MSKAVARKRQLLSPEGVLRVVRAIQSADAAQVITWADIQRFA